MLGDVEEYIPLRIHRYFHINLSLLIYQYKVIKKLRKKKKREGNMGCFQATKSIYAYSYVLYAQNLTLNHI